MDFVHFMIAIISGIAETLAVTCVLFLYAIPCSEYFFMETQQSESLLCRASYKTLGPALKGNLYSAFSMMLEDGKAIELAEIEVENINGPILILSGTIG